MTYHYTQCGLDYVFLENGYVENETPYGKTTAFKNADALGLAIAVKSIVAPTRLRGQEVRFLRGMLDCSQVELASELGIKRLTVARWESKPHTPIPGPADRVIRMLVAYAISDEKGMSVIIESMSEISDGPVSEIRMIYRPDVANDDLFSDAEPSPDDTGWSAKKVASQ